VRAMTLTSGVASALHPPFNLWNSVEPYAAQLIRDERGNIVQDVAQQALDAASVALRLPRRLDSLADQLENGTLAVSSPRLEKQVARLDLVGRRIVSALLFGALLIAGVLLRPDDEVLGTVLMAVSALPLLHVLFAGRR
jgi:predicted unusual protein kinase regulating ubiquinone biosynthesis (AarF/ABC1/UbiB family)